MSNTKRIEWVDACKAFAMLTVVVGHVADGYLGAGLYPAYRRVLSAAYDWVYSFHMALFFALSGFVFYKAYGAHNKLMAGGANLEFR